ncbi:hypothetical protein CAEBREN_09295 [Caenorhabditis brenneri]|uniref:Uncharacterized protein n=1 Tax=Caenorhabditis brenneri TaxID=135651 RepID=G0MBF8_CAEBE|nr:hypothetical protein CAEBREN_09295 [Caenorhabditis brenneri]
MGGALEERAPKPSIKELEAKVSSHVAEDMQRSTSLILFLVIFQLAAFGDCGDMQCFEGFVGDMTIESGFDMCAVSVDMENNEKQYFGKNGEMHIFNKTRPIDWSQGDCFVIFEYDTVYTYCYCRENLCNKPKGFQHIMDTFLN